MRNAKLYRYCLPMDSGVILRDQRLTQREGWIVELEHNGSIGRSEIAPLIGFSLETTEQAGEQAQALLAQWVSGESRFTPTQLDTLFPSVAFGLSMAQMELEKRLPVAGNYQVAPLCSGDPDELIPLLNAMQGQKVAKIKVGLYEAIRDGMIVNLLLESIPELYLRLDANRAWTVEKAAKFAKYISPSLRSRIAFLEEPCKQPSNSISFSMDTGIAIAWDETLQESVRESDFNLDELTGVRAIVIKPTLIGSVERCIALIEKAHRLGIQAIISSSIESSLGLTQLARLAHWQLPNEVPGLDTIGLFKQQLETPWPNCELPMTHLSEQSLVWQAKQTCQ